jgi:tetratricopeptide (TPR) repeat protein
VPSPRTVSATLRDEIALSPAVILGALAFVPLVIFFTVKGGFFPEEWYPGTLFLVALLVVGVLALPSGRRAPAPVLVATGTLAAYAAWSYLTIAWADQRGDAWDGANRTALYAVLFALFALWRLRGRAAVTLVGVFALSVAVIGLVELLSAAAASDPTDHFIDGRLAKPVGYANANAALWSLAFWPCVVLASRRETGPLLRALFTGSAVLLGGLALMGQSRGWLFALPLVAIAFLLITPQRVRTTLTLALVLAATAVTIPSILDVYDEGGSELAGAMDDAAVAILAAATVAAAVAGLVALADRRRRASPAVERWAGVALAVVAAGAFLVGSVVYVAERGSPFSDVADAWDEFKTKPTPAGGSTRLGRLGSNRYDFWRVAWEEFSSQPVGGIGADNFQQAYLREAESSEQPRYPHSVELRTLSQTGLVGTALLAVALGAALAAALRATRLRSGPARAAAAAGLGAFAYWFVHGSVDWFWEIPALGGVAFALLGLAAGLAPRAVAGRPARRRRPLAAGPARVALTAGLAIVLGLSLAGPWLAERYTSQAIDLWRYDDEEAFDKLDRAASLNPLSPSPDVAAGSIALRLDRPQEAESRFREALDREPGDSYSHLELGAIVFNDGRRAEGLRHLRRARRLDPRDEIIEGALTRARRGREIDITAMNRAIASRYRELGE